MADIYARILVDMRSNPKVADLPDGAFRLYIEAILWAVEHLTDGHIPDRELTRIARSARRTCIKRATQLVDAGVWEACTDGWQIHDFLTHQRSREEVQRRTENRRMAGQKGGRTRAARQANSQATAGQDGKQVLEADACPDCYPTTATTTELTLVVSKVPEESCDKQPDDDDGEPDRPAPEQVAAQAVDAAVDRRLDGRNLTRIQNLDAYRAKIRSEVHQQHHGTALALARQGQALAAIVDTIAPNGRPTTTATGQPPKTEADRLTRPDCERCNGSGWILDDDDRASRCDWCNR